MNKPRAFALCAVLLSGLLVAGAGWTSSASYDLAWWTVDGGGKTFSPGGGYQLGGTAGQPDAGLMAGVGYTLGGGFWRGGETAATPYRVYLPLVMR